MFETYKKGGMAMKKKMQKWKSLAAILLAVVMLTGCGASKEMATSDTAAYEYSDANYMTNDIYTTEMASEAPMEEAVVEEEGVTADTSMAEGAESESIQPQQTERKLIKNVDLQVETETFDELFVKVNDKTESLGGYVENSYMYNGSSFYGNGNRDASLTIRIPADHLDEFLSAVSEVSNVISRNDSVTDITLQYVDLESRKEALMVEQDRLLELMEQAETIEDIIALESRLSEVRYELESMESRLRTYDNQVSYSTVYLHIQEVTKLTPVKEQTIGEKITTGFTESLYGVGNGLLNFGIGFIIKLPYLVVWAIVIAVFVLIIKGIRKAGKKRKAKKAQKKQAEMVDMGVQEQNADIYAEPDKAEAVKQDAE